ncbi:hypothetical protein DSO57_1032500 [Entomophthora muscae]|uniref:Uncharacterized protein n=1 Tax=Entomophthora muscae TaxID=34485 RepID=A0ACC2RF01_9FUNG|nr:hypothetical protein DSO57_1032500 [Entomophthora muscae]
MDEKIVVHLIIYGAVAGGLLGLLGIGYIYRKWFRLPQIVDELAEAGLAKADYTFPVTLNVAGRVAAKDELSLHFFHKATIQASHAIPYNTKSYFEVEIIYLPSTTRLYVGLAPRSLNEELIPGCTMNTVAAECQQGIVICEGSPSSIDAPLLPGDTLGILAFHGELLNLRVLRDGKVGWAGTRINIRLPLLPHNPCHRAVHASLQLWPDKFQVRQGQRASAWPGQFSLSRVSPHLRQLLSPSL